MTEAIKKKIEVQKEALAKAYRYKKSLVVAATGAGKSKIGIDYAKLVHETKKGKAKICLVVPTEKLRDENWYEEFEKWESSDLWESVDRFCYASLSKIEGKEYDLVILDEVHNITPLSATFFEVNKVDRAIGLTATMPRSEEKKDLIKQIGLKKAFELGLEEAIELGLVSPFNIKVVELELDRKEKNIVSGSKKNPFMQTEYSKYMYLSNVVDSSKFTPRGKFAILNRMRFIYNLPTKTNAAKQILESNLFKENERVLAFCGSIKQADELLEDSYHSKSGKESLKKFEEKKINRLSCVKSLNEGANIADIDSALIVQLTSKELDMIQRIGRTIRYKPGHTATIYILVVKETQDYSWCEKALANISPDRVERLTFEKFIRQCQK